MEQSAILAVLNERYPLRFDKLEFFRDGGSMSYAAFAQGRKYFLRVTKPAFFDTVRSSLDICLFLQQRGFSVPPILFTTDGAPYVQISADDGGHLLILYEFIGGDEVDPERDAEKIGAFVGKLHSVMKDYPKPLIKRDKHFYIGRYLEIMGRKHYPRADAFAAYGDALWEQVKNLPQGYCHGDLYRGNILQAKDGGLYLLDLDTSCEGFRLYDPVLICNMTDFFTYREKDYFRTKEVFGRFLPEYQRHSTLTPEEIRAFYAVLALYHFALQATIIETYGLDCVDNAFLDNQLDLLYKWRKQCYANV